MDNTVQKRNITQQQKQNIEQQAHEKQQKENNETKQLKLSIASSLKSDLLENKYNKIIAINEDEDDLDSNNKLKKGQITTNNLKIIEKKETQIFQDSSFQVQTEKSISTQRQLNLTLPLQKLQTVVTQDGYQYSDKNTLSNKQETPISLQIPNKKINELKVNQNVTLNTQQSMSLTQRAQLSHYRTISQTLSRQKPRVKQLKNSQESVNLKQLFETSQGQIRSTQSPQQLSNGFQTNSQRGGQKQFSYSQSSSFQKLLSPKSQQNDVVEQNQFTKQFPLSSRNSLITPNQQEKPYFSFISRKDSDSMSNQIYFKRNETPKQNTLGGEQTNRQVSMLFSQKQVNDIDEIRKRGKTDFYAQLNSFDNQSPINPKKTIQNIEYNALQQKIVSEFNTTTSAQANGFNTRKSNQSANKYPETNRFHQRTLSTFSQAFPNPASFYMTDSQFNPLDAIDGIVHKQSSVLNPAQSYLFKNKNSAINQMNSQKKQNQGAYKINEYLSKRKDVEGIRLWMLQTLDEVSQQENITLYSLFSQQQLIFNACISELIRQISIECKDRAELVQSIWNNHVETVTKVVEFYSKENNRVEWDTLTQVKSLHKRYREELQYSQKVYEENNQKYHDNKKQLEKVINKYRSEKKINKKLEKLCSQLKNDKMSINNLYCETSKEYIQLMINTGKLSEEQEQSLLQQYVEASRGFLTRKLEFKKIKESIRLKEKSQKEYEYLVDRIVAGKTPPESDESIVVEDTEVKEKNQKRKVRYEEKCTQVEDTKVNQETETEFNKLFMVSKGIQIYQNPKKTHETQTEIEIYHQSVQTEAKQLKSQYAQTEMTVSKNSDDFEKLKTVYLKKVKVDPLNKQTIEEEGNHVEEFNSNYLSILQDKSQKKSQDDSSASPKLSKINSSQKNTKKGRASMFAQSLLRSDLSQHDSEDTSYLDDKSDDEYDNSYQFESQKKLKISINRLIEYSKLIKVDTKNPKYSITNFVEVTKDSLKQFNILTENIKKTIENMSKSQIVLELQAVDQAIDIEEFKNIQTYKDKQTDILLNNQAKINKLVEDLNISTDDEQQTAPAQKLVISQNMESQIRNKTRSYASQKSIQIMDPFSHHQNVQNQVTESENQRKDKSTKKQGSLKQIPSMIFKGNESQTNQSQNIGSMTDKQFQPKHVAFQRRQSQMVQQIFHTSSQVQLGQLANQSQTNIPNFREIEKYKDKKQLLKKIQNFISNNCKISKLNITAMDFQNRQKQCLDDSEVFFIVEQLQYQSNKNNVTAAESIGIKNTIIQIRKLLQQVYFDLIQVIKNHTKLNKPLSILLKEFFTQQQVESKTIVLSKMKKTLEKCLVIPNSYEEIKMFTQLIGINNKSDESFDQSEFINIYLQMLHYLNEDSKYSENPKQLQIITTQIETNTVQIYKYLPSILSTYLPEKTVYDIVMHLLKPYIVEGEISERDNLVNIPQPNKSQLNLNEVILYVMSKLKDHTLQISKIYNPLFECLTFSDSEEINEEQFMFIQKYLGSQEKIKTLEYLYKFRDLTNKQAMDKQTFVGFCNSFQVIDYYKLKNVMENKEFDDLTNFDFETLEKLEPTWKKQKTAIQKLMYDLQIYKPIHKRLITVVDVYIQLIKKNMSYKKYYKTHSLLAYKLIKMETRYYLEYQQIKQYMPDNLLMINEMSQPLLITAELNFINRKQRVLQKDVSVVYPNVFQKISQDKNEEQDNQSSNSSISESSEKYESEQNLGEAATQK